MNRHLYKSVFFFVLLAIVMTYPVVVNRNNLLNLSFYDMVAVAIGLCGFYSITKDLWCEARHYKIVHKSDLQEQEYTTR